MFVSDLCDYLRATGIIPPDVPIQTGMLGAQQERGVLIMPPLTGYRVYPTIPGYHSGSTKIIVRDPDPVAGHALALQIYEALWTSNFEVGDYKVKSSTPYSLPVTYPKNDAALFEHSVEFDTRFTAQ